jgi:MarR-like DNA-binding transcriptional regulator SgrR of sgrS sRNA
MIPRRIPILLILLGMVLLVLSMFPLTVPTSANTSTDSMNWKLPVPTPIPKLNPQQVVAASDKSLALLVFSRLVRTDEYMEVLPDLLENWSFDLNQNLATLRIRDSVKFHDGSAVTAEDIAFSFHYWTQPLGLDNNLLFLIKGAEEYSNGLAKQISGIRVVDPRTLHVRLTQPAPEQFVSHLAQPRFCVYPKRFRGKTESDFFAKPVGTGPFRLASYEPERAEFTANSEYHLGRPRLNSITVMHLTADAAVAAFKVGEIDNLIMFHPRDPALLAGPGIKVKRLPRASTFTIILNGDHPDLRDEAVRQQIAAGFVAQRQKVAANCFPGSEVAQSYIPPGFVGHVPMDSPELSEALTPPEPRTRWSSTLTFFVPPSENGECVSNVLSPSLSKQGIRTSTREVAQMFELLKRKKLHLWAETFAFKSDEAFYNLRYFTSSTPEFLLGQPVDFLEQTFGRLTVPGLSQLERGHLYHQMDQYLIEHAHIVPMAHFSEAAVYRSRIRNLEFLITGRFAANWHQIEVRESDEESL